MSCSNVQDQIAAKPQYSEVPGYCWVHNIEDIVQIYYNTCGDDGITSIPPPDPVDSCYRDEGVNWNQLEGMELNSAELLDSYFNNQPCGEDEFNFFIAIAYYDGGDQGNDYRHTLQRNQLINPPVYEIKSKWVLRCLCNVTILKLKTSPTPKYVDFAFPVFADNHNDNNWTESLQGDQIKIAIEEFDVKLCTTSTASTTTNTIEFDFDVELVKLVNGVKVKSSANVTRTTSYSGTAVAPVGKRTIYYCDDYNPNHQYEYGNLYLDFGCYILN